MTKFVREQNFSDERRGEMEGQSRGRGTVALYKQAQDCTLLLCYAQVSKLNVGSWTIFLLTFFNNMVFEVGRNCPLSRAWSMRTGEFPILDPTRTLSVASSSNVLKKRTLENGRKSTPIFRCGSIPSTYPCESVSWSSFQILAFSFFNKVQGQWPFWTGVT